ncbi:MAG: DUF3341 domain-containing protein [Bdellovibrionales bacterium]|nr:DUF3341 domain-containing protein [Bdellovibrionales bacterium]
MAKEYVVVGRFHNVDDTAKAIRLVRGQNREDFNLYTPFPNHELEDVAFEGKKRSPVRRWTLLGGMTGCTGAFLMTIWMSMDYPLRTSAKTVISIPAFVIIAFECTILLGALFTLVGMLHHSRVPNIFASPGFRGNFTKDEFGLAVRVEKNEADKLKAELEKCGAAQVEVQYVR